MAGESRCCRGKTGAWNSGFNGAPDLWPGRVRIKLIRIGARRLASMEPRTYGRGGVEVEAPTRDLAMGFNGAPDLWPGRVRVPAGQLQRLRGASMEPRTYGRGEMFRLAQSRA